MTIKSLCQTSVLFWKNILIFRRNYLKIIALYVMSLLVCIALIMFRRHSDPIKLRPKKVFEEKNIFEQLAIITESNPVNLLFTPNNCHRCSWIIDHTVRALEAELPRPVTTQSFSTNLEMDSFLKKDDTNNMIVAIMFDDITNRSQLNIIIKFRNKLRLLNWKNLLSNAMHTFETGSTYRMLSNSNNTDEELPDYHGEGVTAIAYCLVNSINKFWNEFITKSMSAPKFDPVMYTQRFSENEIKIDLFLMQNRRYFGAIIAFICSFHIIYIINLLVKERQGRLKEMMRIAGMESLNYWLSWWMFTLLYTFPLVIIIFVTLKCDFFYIGNLTALTSHTNGIILFFFLFLYVASLQTYAFLCSNFFKDQNLAMLINFLIYYLSCVPLMLIIDDTSTIPLILILLMSFLPNIAMGLGINIIIELEVHGQGLQWNSIVYSTNFHQYCTFKFINAILLLDMIIAMILTLYFEGVMPANFFIPKPWHWIFTFWRMKDNEVEIEFVHRREIFEKEKSLPIGIRTVDLTLRSKEKLIISNVSLDVYQNRVTVLLGENNSGVNSLLNMIAGVKKPSSGNIIINGFNVRTNLKEVRINLGFSSHILTLYNELTVQDHIYLFARLRKMSVADATKATKYYMHKLLLMNQKSTTAAKMSRTMGRKVSIAMAFIGAPKVIILEDPTVGLDNRNKQAVWELIQLEKAGRTILLGTRSMDDAQVVADKIAVMMNGRMLCCGTSDFLSNMYTVDGYRLRIWKTPEYDCEAFQRYLVRHKIERPYIIEEDDFCTTFHLDNKNVQMYEGILRTIPKVKEKFGIIRFTFAPPNVLDIYNKICSMEKSTVNKSYPPDMVFKKYPRSSSRWQIFKSLIRKNITLKINHWFFMLTILVTIICIMVIVPVVMLIFQVYSPLHLDERVFTSNPLVFLESGNDEVVRDLPIIHFINLNDKGIKVVFVHGSLDDHFYKMQKTDPKHAKLDVLYGIEYKDNNKIKCWHNGFLLIHSALLCGQIMANIRTADIWFSPFSYKGGGVEGLNVKFLEQYTYKWMVAVQISFWVFCCFLLFHYIEERPFKRLQMMTGISYLEYWISAFICDYIIYLVYCLIVLVIMISNQLGLLSEPNEMFLIFTILITFGLTILPMCYLMSFIFSDPILAFFSLMIYLVVGELAYSLVPIILNGQMFTNKTLNVDYHAIVAIFNSFKVLTVSLRAIYRHRRMSDLCDNVIYHCMHDMDPKIIEAEETTSANCRRVICKETKQCCNSFNSFPLGIHQAFIFFFINLLITWMIIVLIESHVFTRCRFKMHIAENLGEDESVTKERILVQGLKPDDMKNYSFVIKNLVKTYGKRQVLNGLCFSVVGSGCVGITGENGSGKSVLIRLFNRCDLITYGGIWFQGTNLLRYFLSKESMGFSGQYTDLSEFLTVRQLLELVSQFHGYLPSSSKKISVQLARYFEMEHVFNTQVRYLTLYMRKQISNYVALIGLPSFTFFDEPYEGLGPQGIKKLQNVMKRMAANGKFILLTCPNVEECIELDCIKVGVINHGTLDYICSPFELQTHLKKLITLIIRISKLPDTHALKLHRDTVEQEMHELLPNLQTHQIVNETLFMSLEDDSVQVTDVIFKVEKLKEKHPIEKYFVQRQTLFSST